MYIQNELNELNDIDLLINMFTINMSFGANNLNEQSLYTSEENNAM